MTRPTLPRAARRSARALIITIGVAGATAASASAGTVVVDATTDNGAGCTLREAVAVAQTGVDANECTGATAGANTVSVPAGNYPLVAGNGPLVLTAPVTIEGAGRDQTTVSGGGATRVLDVTGAEAVVTVRGITVATGRAPNGATGTQATPEGGDGESGGGIRNAGVLTLEAVTVSGSFAGAGGTGYNAAGQQSMLPRGKSNSLGGDGGAGGGIYNTGSLRLTGTSVIANTAGAGGAGIRQLTGQDGESGYGGDGGGIYSTGAVTADATSVIAGNTAGAGGTADPGGASGGANGPGPYPAGTGGRGGNGGGITGDGSGTITLTGTLVNGNAAGAGGSGGACAAAMQSSDGGIGGDGGGLFSGGSGRLVVSGARITANNAGVGGSGNTGNNNQSAIGGDAGPGGSGGGVATAAGATTTLSASEVSRNGAGNPGAFGAGSNAGGGNPQPGLPAAPGNGGGLHVAAAGDLTATTTTVARNHAGEQVNGAPARGLGDGAFVGGTAVLAGDTLVENRSTTGAAVGTGLHVATMASATLTASLTSKNGAAECTGTAPGDGGGNLSFGGTPCPAASTADPQLPAADSAGPNTIPLMLPPAASSAIDVVATTVASCSGLDARGAERPQGAGCDAGAVERLGNAEVGATALTQVSATVVGRASAEADTTATLYLGTSAATLAPVGDPLAVTGGTVAPATPTAQVTGLQPATTYVIQTRLAGGGADLAGPVRTFTTLGTAAAAPSATPTVVPTVTPAVPKLTLGRVRATSTGIRARVTCTDAPCAARVYAGTRLRRKGKTMRTVGVTLAKRNTTAYKVALTQSRTLRPGQTQTVRLALRKPARRLLQRFHRLPVNVTVRLFGKTVATAKVTVKPRRRTE